jgi:hypothetical protein
MQGTHVTAAPRRCYGASRHRARRVVAHAAAHSLPRVTGPCVWHGPQLARDAEKWTHTLSGAELEELDAAVSHCAATVGDDLLRITESPLAPDGPVSALLHRVRHCLYSGHGLYLLRGLPVHDWGLLRSAVAYWLLSLALGTPVPQNGAGHLLGHVKDVGSDPSKPTTRLYQTSAAQPFHTDSCDVVGLLCLKQATHGGDSQVVSSAAVFNALADASPHLAGVLLQPFHVDRKGEVPAGKEQTFQMPVFCTAPDGRLVSMYDRSFIAAAAARWPATVPPLTTLQQEALDAADALAASPELRLDMRLCPGDIQLLHNHAIWHARGAFTDAGDGQRSGRHLLRMWLAGRPADAWPLPPVFAERYGTVDVHAVPPRGGIRVPGMQLCAPLDATVPV